VFAATNLDNKIKLTIRRNAPILLLLIKHNKLHLIYLCIIPCKISGNLSIKFLAFCLMFFISMMVSKMTPDSLHSQLFIIN